MCSMLTRALVCAFVGILTVTFPCRGQAIGQPLGKFTVSHGKSEGDFVKGAVWVKLKKEHKNIFDDQSRGRMPQKINAKSIHPLLKKQSYNNARVAPRKQRVDIALYHKLIFDENREVEEFICELKSTGYFEAVEPVFREAPLLEPNDPMLSQQYALDRDVRLASDLLQPLK